ncbi:hypothetical protein HMPREF1870_01266, partial [Bacteroidales bacterium KA00344]
TSVVGDLFYCRFFIVSFIIFLIVSGFLCLDSTSLFTNVDLKNFSAGLFILFIRQLFILIFSAFIFLYF